MFLSAFKISTGAVVKSVMLKKKISAVFEDLDFSRGMHQEASHAEVMVPALKGEINAQPI